MRLLNYMTRGTTFTMGEFPIPAGTSAVAPGVDPVEPLTLRFDTLNDLANGAGISRIYGGIHTNATNKTSLKLGVWVAERVIAKLGITRMNIATP
jgi:hypothetical protein